ncbi:glycoside hydrolase [Haloprofundus halophilus]|uniref:glycoside hydrolase n=1 Tax=Haloprofundus halophilus TaxID=2283527 RepID=UPI0018E580A3|nr:glycoside hydrolase [Haloprofundus halophilus]
MVRQQTRRQFLAAGATATTAAVAGCLVGSADAEGVFRPPVDLRGAIYLPARAYNTYQMWADYDEAVVERDLGYAASLNLNAVRTWVNYEFWMEDPEAHRRAIDHFLAAAAERDIGVLLGLFEGVGQQPTEANLEDTDPLTATAVQSPALWHLERRDRWENSRRFVRWFMARYRDDERLLAIEAMNEPGWASLKLRFAEAMFRTLTEERGSVPLTVGSTSLANNAQYLDWGADILQFHYNFANRPGTIENLLADANRLASRVDKPVWFSEWQRIRTGVGFTGEVTHDDWYPNYSSLAPVIRRAGVDNFFWSLMIKPAYVVVQRKNGVVNGVFHEDGAVWSLDDARALKAMSGDDEFHAEERPEWPAWAESATQWVPRGPSEQ